MGGGVDGENTFLPCCVLYGRREYPSFYCTLIYYNETGEKAGRASVWRLHGSARRPAVLPGRGSPLNTPLRAVFEIFLWFSPPSAPLSVLRHVDGPPGWDRRAPVRDAQHLHGLPLWSPFAVTVQHGGVHPLPGRICGRARGTRKEVIRLTRAASASYCICILRHKFRTL